MAVFVDLKNACYRVWKGRLLLKLQRYGINGRMYNWLKGFFSNRYIRTKVNGVYSRTRPSKEGLPQGGALSCTLFLCFLNDPSLRPSPPSIVCRLRTTSQHQSDKNVDLATDALNRDLYELKRHCDQWCMQINTTKTVYNIYSNSREVLARELELKIEDKCLQRDRQVPPTGFVAAVPGHCAGITAEPNRSCGAVSDQSPGTNRADEETCRYRLGCIFIATQNPVCYLRTFSPGVRESHPQPSQ